MCLINVAHEHLTTQTGKTSKPALVNVMGPGAEGPRGRRAEGRGPRKTNTLSEMFEMFDLLINPHGLNKLFFVACFFLFSSVKLSHTDNNPHHLVYSLHTREYAVGICRENLP